MPKGIDVIILGALLTAVTLWNKNPNFNTSRLKTSKTCKCLTLEGLSGGAPASTWGDEVQAVVTTLSKQQCLIPLAFQSAFGQTSCFSDQSLFFSLSILLMVTEGPRTTPPLPVCAPTTPRESSFCPVARIAPVWDSTPAKTQCALTGR